MINTMADLVLCVVTPLIVVYNSSVSDTKVNIMFRRPFVRVCLLILILIFVALVSLRPLWVYFVGKTEPKIICLVYIEVKLWIQLNLWSQLNPKLKRFNKILCDVRERRIILSVLDPSPSSPAPIKERLKTVGRAANLFQSFRHMSASLALGTIYMQLLSWNFAQARL